MYIIGILKQKKNKSEFKSLSNHFLQNNMRKEYVEFSVSKVQRLWTLMIMF